VLNSACGRASPELFPPVNLTSQTPNPTPKTRNPNRL
jgi:hypothetical protein